MNLAEGLQHLSVLIGIWVAIYGIDAWRREHVGKRQLELYIIGNMETQHNVHRPGRAVQP